MPSVVDLLVTKSKSSDSNAFLSKLVEEMYILLESGVDTMDVHMDTSIRNIVCDAPSIAFV